MPKLEPNRETIREQAASIPLVHDGVAVTEKTALAILDDLERYGSAIPDHIREQIATLTNELKDKIGDDVPELVLRGIVARAAIAGAAQVISDAGQTFMVIEAFKEQLGLKEELVNVTHEPPFTY